MRLSEPLFAEAGQVLKYCERGRLPAAGFPAAAVVASGLAALAGEFDTFILDAFN